MKQCFKVVLVVASVAAASCQTPIEVEEVGIDRAAHETFRRR